LLGIENTTVPFAIILQSQNASSSQFNHALSGSWRVVAKVQFLFKSVLIMNLAKLEAMK
jgi:hypothetical protein